VLATGEILQQQVAQLFDLKTNEVSQFANKIQTLIDYAKTQTDNHSPEGIKWAIRDLSFKVGTPPLGEKMINYLTLYAYTRSNRDKLDKQIAKIERRNDDNS